MSVFRGVFTCENCGVEAGAHVGDALACPRPVSQPLSRVVAGPGVPRCHGGAGHCGSEWCGVCASSIFTETSPASSLIADVAAFRALTPEQRTALLQIGADGVALLEAARAAAEDPSNRETVLSLRPPVARIDMRVGRECSHCAFVHGPGHVEMPCKHQRIAADKSS